MPSMRCAPGAASSKRGRKQGAAGLLGMTDDEALAKLRDVRRGWSTRKLRCTMPPRALGGPVLPRALDSIAGGDVLPARALANAGARRGVPRSAEPSQEALLASAMGYRESARSIASPLPGRIRFGLRPAGRTRCWRVPPGGTPWVKLPLAPRLTDLGRTDDARDMASKRAGGAAVSIASLTMRFDTRRGRPGAQHPAHASPGESCFWSGSFPSSARRRSGEGSARSCRVRGPGSATARSLRGRAERARRRAPIGDQVVAAFFRGAFYSGRLGQSSCNSSTDMALRRKPAAFSLSLGALAVRRRRHLGVWVNAQLPFPTAHEYVQGSPGRRCSQVRSTSRGHAGQSAPSCE